MKATISNALATLKMYGKQDISAVEEIGRYLCRQDNVVDPLAKRGQDSRTYVDSLMQAMRDRADNRIKIRNAINAANQAINLTIDGQTLSIAGWLVWRREISTPLSQAYAKMRQQIDRERQRVAALVTKDDGAKLNLVVATDEGALNAAFAHIATVLGELDANLSVINATHEIEW